MENRIPPISFGARQRASALFGIALLCMLAAAARALPPAEADAAATKNPPMLACQAGSTLASGRPDPSLFAREASKGVRAFWCERYDALGKTQRVGAYWEVYPNGRPRTQALYVDSRLSGPVTIRHEDGSVFLRGFLEDGQWSGGLEIHHANGAIWFEARFAAGQLDGEVRTHYPDGALESESHYQRGREDGLARSFYPTLLGGRLKSEAHVEADRIVGRHRVLGLDGEIVRAIDWEAGPAAWLRTGTAPAAPATAEPPAPTGPPAPADPPAPAGPDPRASAAQSASHEKTARDD